MKDQPFDAMKLPNEANMVHQWQIMSHLFVCVIVAVHHPDRVRALFTVYSLN